MLPAQQTSEAPTGTPKLKLPRKQLIRYQRFLSILAFEQDVDRTGSIAALANSKVLLVFDLENMDKVSADRRDRHVSPCPVFSPAAYTAFEDRHHTVP